MCLLTPRMIPRRVLATSSPKMIQLSTSDRLMKKYLQALPPIPCPDEPNLFLFVCRKLWNPIIVLIGLPSVWIVAIHNLETALDMVDSNYCNPERKLDLEEDFIVYDQDYLFCDLKLVCTVIKNIFKLILILHIRSRMREWINLKSFIRFPWYYFLQRALTAN